jgi:hypothetical protein
MLANLDFPSIADLYRLSVEKYHAMIDHGILQNDDPVELLEGYLICRSRKTLQHRVARGLLNDWLLSVLPSGFYLQIQDPITMSTSEPEPDASIVRGDVRGFERHPGPGDTSLVIEIADDSLARDRNWKRLIYAAAGIPIYWILNLVDRRVEIYQEPAPTSDGADYAKVELVSDTEEAPLILDGVEIARIAVRDLLP